MFQHISRYFKVRQKYCAARGMFKSYLGVWKCDKTLCPVFGTLHKVPLLFTSHYLALFIKQGTCVKESIFSQPSSYEENDSVNYSIRYAAAMFVVSLWSTNMAAIELYNL